MGKTSKDKLLKNDHYCKPPRTGVANTVYQCSCGAQFTYREHRGQVVPLMTRDAPRGGRR